MGRVCVCAWYICEYVCIYEIRKIFALNLKGKTTSCCLDRGSLPACLLSRVYILWAYTTYRAGPGHSAFPLQQKQQQQQQKVEM